MFAEWVNKLDTAEERFIELENRLLEIKLKN